MEMTKEEWARWKAHPTTVNFFKYIDDIRQEIGRDIGLAVAVGQNPDPEMIAQDAMRCDALYFVVEVGFEDIEGFYSEDEDETIAEKQEDEDGAEDS